jgi:hypothetical protein
MGVKGRPARGAENLTAICEPIVYRMWEPRRLTTLWAFKACYRDSFTFYLYFLCPVHLLTYYIASHHNIKNITYLLTFLWLHFPLRYMRSILQLDPAVVYNGQCAAWSALSQATVTDGCGAIISKGNGRSSEKNILQCPFT